MNPGIGVRLSTYNNLWYQPGPFWKRALWLVFGDRLLRSWLPFSGMRTRVLRLFGAVIGSGVVARQVSLVSGRRRSHVDRRRLLDRQPDHRSSGERRLPFPGRLPLHR